MTTKATLAHLDHQRSQQSATDIAYYFPKNGQYTAVTWQEANTFSTEISMGLYALGVRKGTCVALISETRAEWNRIDIAILSLGAIVVGIYPTSTAEQIAYILNHSEATVAIVEDNAQQQKIINHQADLAALKNIIVLDKPDKEANNILSLADLRQKGQALLADNPNLPAECRATVEANDIATLVYTSGTTGLPKGVVLRHKNLYTIAKAIRDFLDMDHNDLGVALLPMAHVLQRVNSYVSTHGAISGYYLEDIFKLVEVCQIANPTIISAVPRLFEKIHTRIMSRVEQATPKRQKLFTNALAVGLAYTQLIREKIPVPIALKLKYRLFDRLVFSKMRQTIFGKRIRYLISGGAPMNVALLEFFHAIGLPIFEGYGLTETSSPVTLNRSQAFKFGSVGQALSNTKIKIAADGEILLKGPGVFDGYYKNKTATKEVFTEDGWFKSGDIGHLDEEGFLYITDRKKNIIVTAGGKNIAPANIENLIMSNPYISQVLVHGDRRKYLVALIALDEIALKTWAENQAKQDLSMAQLSQDDDVQAIVANAVKTANQSLARYETIKYFRILPEEMTVDNDMLTPTLKVKRRVVVDKYKNLLAEMYEA